jgi:hypothetical protein
MRHLLLVAPLVSKTWQAITLTPGPQRTLFFQPDLGSEPIQNPLLVEMFPPFFASEPAVYCLERAAKAEDAFKREGASWRRMLVTQPPARTMTVVDTRCMDTQSSSEGRAVLKDVNLPLRMGMLYDLTIPFLDRPTHSSFHIRWHHGMGLKSDLTLTVVRSCAPSNRHIQYGYRPRVEERFKSDEWRGADIKWQKLEGGRN